MSTLGRILVPDEVLTAALRNLPQHELRNVSRVSRGMYRAAHDAGLFLHRNIHSERQSTLDSFLEVVQHATAQRRMFRLALNLMIFRRNEEESTGVPSMEAIWDSLRSTLPFLVRLDVRLYSALAAAAYTALDGPARQLRMLSVRVLDDQANPAPIPRTLFAGDAPRLKTVELSGPVLPLARVCVPAWSGVRTLKACVHYAGQQLPIAPYFPALFDLTVEVCPRRNLLVLDLAGLTLHSLTIKNDSGTPLQYATDASIPPPPLRIRTFHDLCRDLHYDGRHWPRASVLLNAHIQQTFYELVDGRCVQYEDSLFGRRFFDDSKRRVRVGDVVSVSSADASCDWRITQYTKPSAPLGPDARTLSVLDALPPLRERLRSLTIDDALLVRLLETSCTLYALLELHVDCTAVPAPPPNWHWPYDTPVSTKTPVVFGNPLLCCPALARVGVFATGMPTVPVFVARERIAALGLLRCDARVALVLAGVKVDFENDAGPTLQEVFASVHVEDAQAVRCVPDYYHYREDNPRLVG